MVAEMTNEQIVAGVLARFCVGCPEGHDEVPDESDREQARLVVEALEAAGRLIPEGAEVEWGWVSKFSDGQEYEWLGGMTREQAEERVECYSREEEDVPAKERLAFTLRHRSVVAGPWMETPGE